MAPSFSPAVGSSQVWPYASSTTSRPLAQPGSREGQPNSCAFWFPPRAALRRPLNSNVGDHRRSCRPMLNWSTKLLNARCEMPSMIFGRCKGASPFRTTTAILQYHQSRRSARFEERAPINSANWSLMAAPSSAMNARSLSPRSWLMNSHTPSLRRLAACFFAVSPAPTFQPRRLAVPLYRPTPNPAVDPVPLGHFRPVIFNIGPLVAFA